jgi:Zn-dependent peptidase ImmA (M78 family)/transcriptional regulator with XRE-family HTH domain
MEITAINPKMIVLAREYRGINQEELAQNISITQGYLSKIEKGLLLANEEVLERLCATLKLDAKFFSKKGDIFPPNLYYRKKTKTPQRTLNKIEAEMNIHRLNIHELLTSIDIDTQPLGNFDLEEHLDPKLVARKVRQLWGIPSGPINNLYSIIERKGVVMVSFDFESLDIDGRSMFTDKKQPIIFVNSSKPMCRQRFTVAHELGHLLMHIGNSISEERDIEKEANIFANEFLIPEMDLRKQILTGLTLHGLADLKRYWKVSMQAILYKAHSSKIITDYNHKNLLFETIKLKIKSKEPAELDPEIENPGLLKALIKLHLNDLEFSVNELATLMGFLPEEFMKKYTDEEPKKLRMVY